MGEKKIFYQSWVYGRAEKLHKETPEDILSNLKDCVKNCQEWDISPKELIEIISKPGFPEKKANEIKIFILDYHTSCLETDIGQGDIDLTGYYSLGETPDIFIATHCYYTVFGDAGFKAKGRYRKAIIEKSIDGPLSKGIVEVPSRKKLEAWKINTADPKNFYKFFGPDPCNWERKIRKKFEQDFAPAPTPEETGN